jgi:hypothetical protein
MRKGLTCFVTTVARVARVHAYNAIISVASEVIMSDVPSEGE